MTGDRWWTAALVYPAPLYAAVVVFLHFGTQSIAFPVGFSLAAGFGSVSGFGILRSRRAVEAGRLLFVLGALVPVFTGVWTGGVTVDLAGGILLGSSFLWLEYAWRDTVSPGARAIALQSALLVGVLGLAAVGEAPPAGLSSGGAFLHALGQALSGQVQGIGALLGGGTPNGMPLEATLDLAYVAFGALAFAGVMLSWTSPRTPLGEPLPWSWGRYRSSSPASVADAEDLGLRPGQVAALESRTLPEPPETMLAPGFGSVLVVSVLVVAFLIVAVAAPEVALLTLVLGTLAALVAVAAVLSRRLTPTGRLSA